MNRTLAGGTVIVAVLMVTSVFALPFLGGIGGMGSGVGDNGAEAESPNGAASNPEAAGTTPAADGATLLAANETGQPVFDAGDDDPIEMGATGETDDLSDDAADAVESGVDEGIELVQSQGVEVTQEQRVAAVDAATQSVSQHQDADVEQVQAATAGAVHGSLLQAQEVDVEQVQEIETEHVEAAVGGATDGALAQHQTVNASQMQSATWGAAHGGLAQYQHVTVEQIQIATLGAAAGAASEAGAKDVEKKPKIQEAAQGSAYGTLEQYQKITAEQRQQVTIEHAQHAAAGAAAGALAGTTEQAIEQDQRITVEQRQQVTIKQVQKAATGAAKGALVQKQDVSAEQTQFAARGAGKGPLKQLQTGDVEQVQRISITQIQEASFGAATGAIVQSQEATVEQIQAAADGGAQGVIVQYQEVEVTQIQKAATGAATGAVDSAIQYQIVEIEQIQAASFGAGEGAVLQRQTVSATQVQYIAEGAAGGVLVQHQEVSVEQIQVIASGASKELPRAIQYQQISVTQLQALTFDTAADTADYAIAEGVDDPTVIVQQIEIEIVQKVEQIDEREGEASISLADQTGNGTTVTVDSVSLSEGGFVAIYDGVAADADPEAVIGASGYLSAGDHENVEIELDEPIEASGPIVAVVHHDTTDDETFQYAETDGAEDDPYVTPGGAPILDGAFYTVDEEIDDPEATLSVSDQDGDGTELVVDEANASVEYRLTAEYDDETVESDAVDAGEPVENESLALDPPIEDNTTVDVSVVAAGDGDVADEGDVLANETIEYTVEEAPPEELSVEYTSCERVEISGTLEEGDDLYPRTIWYDTIGPGDAFYTGVTAGEEVEAPFTGTVVMEVGEEEDVEQVDEETVVIEVPDEGNFGSFIVPWVSPADEPESALASPPDDLDCGAEIQPEEPTLTVEDVQPAENGTAADADGDEGDDPGTTAFDVTFGYENPNDAPITGGEFVEGTTADEPPAELAPGEDEFTVAWTPDSDDEVLAWEIPMEDFAYDEPVRVETEPAGAYDAPPEELSVEFQSCDRATVSGTFEDGDPVFASTGFYDTAGYGNTLIEDGVVFGDDVDAPFTGTVVFEVGETSSVTIDEGEDEILVEIADYGTFGTVLSGLTTEEETYLTAGIDHSNPETAACFDEIRPELPTLSYENSQETGDAIAVTFSYENPNDAAVPGGEFDGATDDQPPQQLDSGADEITVEWTPESDDEQLEWVVDMSAFNHTETASAQTPPAGEIAPTEPGEFAIDIVDPIDPAEQGEEVILDVDVENVGGEEATETLSLSVGEQLADADLTLDEGEQQTVSLALDTTQLEPGEYTASVTSATDEDQATVLIEEPLEDDPDEANGVDEADGEAETTGEDEPTETDENGVDANGATETDDGTVDDGATDDESAGEGTADDGAATDGGDTDAATNGGETDAAANGGDTDVATDGDGDAVENGDGENSDGADDDLTGSDDTGDVAASLPGSVVPAL
ncbi:MSCRAMM family adhesin SdrC [Halobacteria archaeon AArc-dxtr1]|nr:MSCRAMM family adhesin SdrC [Halobacteria archaeon AArc-dxtr1]